MLTPSIQHPHTSRPPNQSVRLSPHVRLPQIRTSFVFHPIDRVNNDDATYDNDHCDAQNFSSDLHVSHRFQESEQPRLQKEHRIQELPVRLASKESFLHSLHHTPENGQKEQCTKANHGTEASRFDDCNQIFIIVVHDALPLDLMMRLYRRLIALSSVTCRTCRRTSSVQQPVLTVRSLLA